MGKQRAVLTKKAKELTKALRNHEQSIADLQKLLDKELLDIAFKTWGVKIGSVVRCEKDKRDYKVTVIETRWMEIDGGIPWLRGVPKKKDGTWSERVLYLYGEWHIVES